MEKKFFEKDIYFLLAGLVPKGIKEDHNKWSSFCFPSPNLFGIDIYLIGTIRDRGLVIRTAATVSLGISNFFITGAAIF
jgi:hypothetical protein